LHKSFIVIRNGQIITHRKLFLIFYAMVNIKNE